MPTATSLDADKTQIDEYLRDILPPLNSSVCRAMSYAVLGSGQRLRPILALRAARVLGVEDRATIRAAASVELLHCASLIVDDLPCMDNDSVRRNRASVHVEFGEAIAVLAAFALVSLAAQISAEQPCFQLKLLGTLDCSSLIGGQALDLELAGEMREDARSHVTSLKTVPLFRLAAEAGALREVVPPADQRALAGFGAEFGVAYQMVDDLIDGETADEVRVFERIEETRALLRQFGARSLPLEEMLDYLASKVQVGCHGR